MFQNIIFISVITLFKQREMTNLLKKHLRIMPINYDLFN